MTQSGFPKGTESKISGGPSTNRPQTAMPVKHSKMEGGLPSKKLKKKPNKKQVDKEKEKKDKRNTAMTTERGIATFNKIPVDNYIIQVEASKNYLDNSKELNLIAETTLQKEYQVFIDVKPQTSSFVSMSLFAEEGKIVEKANVTAMLIAKENPETESDTVLFDLYMDKDNKYCAELIPGEYIMIATKSGYNELNEYFKAKSGECVGELNMSQKAPISIIINSIDSRTGDPIPGTLMKVR